MKDFLGNDINVGDNIVLIMPNYRSLTKGVVKSMSAKMIVVEHDHPNISNHKTETKQFPEQVIKIIN